MNSAIVAHLEHTHNLAEHAGAASLAGALSRSKSRLAGKKVVLVMSGGNLSIQHLKIALSEA